jgi:hypothetical protein
MEEGAVMDASGDLPAEELAFPLSKEESDRFAGRSAALGIILRAGEATRIIAAYKREDRRAIEEQVRFSYVATHLNGAVLVTAGIGALILTLGVLRPWLEQRVDARFDQIISWVVAVLGFFGLLVSGYAAARLYELNAGDLARDWMQSRARAEQLRSEYFDRLVAHAATADFATQDAALDLVTKHLLQDQLTYFAQRGKRHEAAAGHWLRLAAFATGVASVGVAAGGMVGAVGGPWLLAIAALGAIGAAVVSFAAAQEAIGQERERAHRFRNNVDALELLARRIEDVRGAIGRGAADALVAFTAAINQQLALELGRFLEGGESIRASITKLSQQIEKSRERKQDDVPKPPGAAKQERVQGNQTGG